MAINLSNITKLILYYQNVRGLRTKCSQLYNNILCNNYDVLLFTETWLQDDIFDSELCDDRYDVYRCDRNLQLTDKRTGGGVMICTRRELCAAVRNEWSCATCESMCVTVPAHALGSTVDAHLVIIYIPDMDNVEERCVELMENLTHLSEQCPNDNILLLGDFNLSCLKWDVNIHYTIQGNIKRDIAISLIDNLGFLGLTQHNYLTNSIGNTLDLCFSNLPLTVSRVLSPIIKEDVFHPSLHVEALDICLQPLKEVRQPRFNFRKCDYSIINDYLIKINWRETLKAVTIDESVEKFYSVLGECFLLHVPVTIYKTNNKSYPVWYSSALIKIIHEKSRAHRRWKSTGNPRDYDEFALLRARQHRVQAQCFRSFTSNAEINIRRSPKFFWKYVKSKRGGPCYPKLFTLNTQEYKDGYSICSAFNKFFESVFIKGTVNTRNNYPPTCFSNTDSISQINVTNDCVLKLLRTLDDSKGPGCDGIPPAFLRCCAESLSLPITILFQQSLRECVFPNVWKKAHIIPIHKKGSKSSIENYRPISILNTVGKLFEKIVYNRIYPIIERGIPQTQHGFLKGRSTTSNLALFSNFVLQHMEGGGQVDVVYTDFKKAFDRVDHSILMDKLQALGIHGDLLRWIRSYISKRSQAVVMGGFRSDFVAIPSGVPQGSHLGTLFYNAYIFDIANCITQARHLMYADDKKIFLRVRSTADCELLQQDLNNLLIYYANNNIKISIDKCQCISFTRRRNPVLFQYKFNDAIVERVSIVRDLGVLFDDKMQFTSHICRIADISYRNLGFVMRTCQPFCCPLSLKVVYFAYVRSTLEYASPVWSPSYAIHKSRIERIQKKFIKHLNYKCKHSPNDYIEDCRVHGILTLEERRDLLDMGLLHDIMRGRLNCPELLGLVSLSTPSRRTRHTPLFSIPFHSTNYGQNAVLTRILRTYNTNFATVDPFVGSKHCFISNIRQKLTD